MLWAEEEFVSGRVRKWEGAWRKLLEILEGRNITLRTPETRELQTMMKANINRVNREHYDALLKKEVFTGQNQPALQLTLHQKKGV